MNAFDVRTKILFLIILIGIVVAVFFSYQKTLVKRNYDIFDSEAGTAEKKDVDGTKEASLDAKTQPVITETENIGTSSVPKK